MSSTRVKKYTREQSSNVAEICYNLKDGSLEVEFHSGKRYRYSDVPFTFFEAAFASSSIGAFISKDIIPVFKCSSMDKRDPQGVDL